MVKISRVEIGVDGSATPIFTVSPVFQNVDKHLGCTVKVADFKTASALAEAMQDGNWFLELKKQRDYKGLTYVAERAVAYGSMVPTALSALSYL
jgi:hypothetical protein